MDDEAAPFEEHRRLAELKKVGRVSELRARLLDLGRIRWQLDEPGGVPELSANLALLVGDPAVDELRLTVRRWAPLLKPLAPPAALKATLLSRLPAGPGRTEVLGSARAGRGLWLVPAWPLPDESRPLAGLVETGWPVTLLRSFPGGDRLLIGHEFERRSASPPGGRDLWIVSTDPVWRIGTLPDHGGGVLTAEISPSGREVLVAHRSGELTLWTWAPDALMPGVVEPLASPHQYAADRCAFSASGREFATATVDGEVWLWDLTARRPIRPFEPQTDIEAEGRVLQLVIDPANQWLVRSLSRAFKPTLTDAWRLADAKRVASLSGVLAAWSPAGLVRTEGDDVMLWDPLTGQTRRLARGWLRPSGLSRRVMSLARRLARTTTDEWVADWAFTTDPDAWIRVVTTQHTHGGSVRGESRIEIRGPEPNRSGTFIPGSLGASTQDGGGHWYAIGTDLAFNEGEVFVCRPGAAEPVRRLGAHAAPVTAAVALADGRLATGDRFGGVRIWSVASDQVGPSQANAFPAMACAAAPDGSWLAIADAYRTVHVLARDGARELFTVPSHENIRFVNGPVYTCLVTGDGRWIVTADDDGTVYVSDARNGARRWTLRGHDRQVAQSVAAMGPSPWLATVDHARQLHVWNLADGSPLHRFQVPQAPPSRTVSLAAGPDGNWLAVAGGRGYLLRPDDGWSAEPLTAGEDVAAVALAGDDWLLVGEHVGTLSLRHSSEPCHVMARWTLPRQIVGVAPGPFSQWVAVVTGENSDAVTLLDLPGGQPMELPTMRSSVRACHPAPNGKLLAAALDDGTALVWNVPQRRAITGIRVGSILHDLTWTPDSSSICLAGASGGYLFDLSRASDVAAADGQGLQGDSRRS